MCDKEVVKSRKKEIDLPSYLHVKSEQALRVILGNQIVKSMLTNSHNTMRSIKKGISIRIYGSLRYLRLSFQPALHEKRFTTATKLTANSASRVGNQQFHRRVPIRPLPIRIFDVAGYQMPIPPWKSSHAFWRIEFPR